VVVTINPVVLEFGPLAVRWFGLLALVGLGLAVSLSLRDLGRLGLGRQQALAALAWGLPAGLLVGHLVHVLGWWDYYLTTSGAIWQLNLDSLSLWGALLGGLLLASARLKHDLPRRRRIFDVIAPNAGLGIAIGRLGAFLDGHGQGLPSDLPWATQYASRLAATPDFGVPRHPAQVYDALIALALFVALSRAPPGLPAGSRLAAFLVLYGVGRVVLGSVRLDPAFLFGLQLEQILALGAIGFGLVYGLRPLVQLRRRARLASDQAKQRQREDPLAA
jgi:phosphatidylglycerol:prolipoprotein diacylglycerol transferase